MYSVGLLSTDLNALLLNKTTDIINPMGTLEAMEFLLDKLRLTKTNDDFFNSMNQ